MAWVRGLFGWGKARRNTLQIHFQTNDLRKIRNFHKRTIWIYIKLLWFWWIEIMPFSFKLAVILILHLLWIFSVSKPKGFIDNLSVSKPKGYINNLIISDRGGVNSLIWLPAPIFLLIRIVFITMCLIFNNIWNCTDNSLEKLDNRPWL